MRTLRRSIPVGLLALALMLPAIGVAQSPKDPQAGSTGGSGAGPTLVPPLVAGAMVGALGMADATASDFSAGATLVQQNPGVLSVYVSSGNIRAPLGLPAGATLWRIDVYGYTTGATTQTWFFADLDTSAGTYTYPATKTTSTGPGIVQATATFSGGLTLAAGHEWYVLAAGITASSSAFVGAVYQYTLPTLSLVSINPTRVYDSRCTGGPLVKGATRTVSVTTAINSSTCATGGSNIVPAGAKAIAYNLTITQTVNAGNLSIYPAGGSSSASAINWFGSGQSLANAGNVRISTGRQVTVAAGGTAGSQTHFIIDITGYYW